MAPSERRKHRDSIQRRINRLTERLAAWEHGNPDPTRRELSSLNFVARVLDAAEENGMLDDLKMMGYDV